MKIKQKYSYLKKEYIDSVILIKSGSFYVTYENDALIINNIFNYQIVNGRVGFPIKSIDKIMKILKEKNVSYVIDDGEEINKFRENNNEYLYYYEQAKRYEFKDSLNKILLDRIKFLIENDDTSYEKIKRFIDEL